MIDLKHFKLIAAVAEYGNLTRAGEQLHLSQSALSHQLSDLERSLDTLVFHRANKTLRLTETGKLLLTAGEKIFQELDRVKTEINKNAKNETGTIRVCTECYTCYNWLPNVIRKFHIRYPNVQIEINTENPVKPLHLIRKKEADIALVFRAEKDKDIVYSKTFGDELVAVVNKNHPLARKEYVTAKDFAREVLITHVKNYPNSFLFEKLFTPSRIMPEKVIYLQLTEAVIEMVRADIGVSIMNRWALKNYLNDDKLKFLRVTPKGFFRNWSLAVTPSNAEKAHLKLFCELALEELSGHKA